MASISEGVDDDDQSVTSAALGIESSATSFTEHSGALHAAAPRHVLLELDDEGDLRSIDGGTTVGDPARRPRRTPPHEPGRRWATGAPRAQGERPRGALVAQAPPRGGRRGRAVDAPAQLSQYLG